MIDWSILWQAPNGRTLLEALLLTFQIAAISWALSLIFGIGIGLLREAPIAALRAAGTVYVEIFRNIPLLLQLGQDRRARQVRFQHHRRRLAYGGSFQRPYLVAVPAPYLPEPAAAHDHARAGIGIRHDIQGLLVGHGGGGAGGHLCPRTL